MHRLKSHYNNDRIALPHCAIRSLLVTRGSSSPGGGAGVWEGLGVEGGPGGAGGPNIPTIAGIPGGPGGSGRLPGSPGGFAKPGGEGCTKWIPGGEGGPKIFTLGGADGGPIPGGWTSLKPCMKAERVWNKEIF